MDEKRAISVILPCYNASKYLDECITAILSQTYSNFELLIYNDASTDESSSIIEKWQSKDARIKTFSAHVNKGVVFARNFLISKARYKILAFCDSDDIWSKNKLEKQILYLRMGYDVVATSALLIDQHGHRVGHRLISGMQNYHTLQKYNPIIMSSAIIDLEKVRSIKFSDIRHEDYDLWLRVARQGHTYYVLDEFLIQLRRTTSSLSGNKIQSLIWHYRVLRANKFTVLKSIILTLHRIHENITRFWRKDD